MKKNWIRYAFLFILAINIAVIGQLGYRQLTAGKRIEKSCPKRNAQFNLTQAQQQTLDSLRQCYQEKRNSLWTVQASHQERLIHLIAASTVDTSRVNETVDHINDAHAKLQHLAIDQLIKEKNMLTLEQQKQLIATLKECHNQACINTLGTDQCATTCSKAF